MRKLFPLAICILLFTGCDLFYPSKKQAAEERERMQQERKARDEERRDKEREWLNENKETARKTATNFIYKKGFSIQSIDITSSNASDRTSTSLSLNGSIIQAYYNYKVITGNTSQDGRLIYIDVRVKYENSIWVVDYFRPYVY